MKTQRENRQHGEIICVRWYNVNSIIQRFEATLLKLLVSIMDFSTMLHYIGAARIKSTEKQ